MYMNTLEQMEPTRVANSSVLIKLISLRNKTLSIELAYTLEGFSTLIVTENHLCVYDFSYFPYKSPTWRYL